jgi:UDPglucose 6-dehydrogenase
MKVVGVVGQGFVGSAIREGLKNYYSVQTYDLQKDLSTCESLGVLVDKAQIIFVCLPTPMRKDGSCDTRIVRKVVSNIDQYAKVNKKKNRIAVIKSTVPPGTTAEIAKSCSMIDVVFSPEFLTEANSFDDFKNQSRIIIGGRRPASSKVKTMFSRAFPSIPIVKTSSTHAEMVKYFINCFLSTKVSFSNEMYQICKNLDLDYDKVVEYAMYDRRLGASHFSVPGPDGHFGFGGHCFPKDLSALISVAADLSVDAKVLKATQKKNDEVRDDRDWEKMSGRAVSED